MEAELLQQLHLKKVRMIMTNLKNILKVDIDDASVEFLSLLRYECSSHISMLERLAIEYAEMLSKMDSRK